MTAPTEAFPEDAAPVLVQTAAGPAASGSPNGPVWTWTPMCRRSCTFDAGNFAAVMDNLARNPNLLSSWLFRADIVWGPGREEEEQGAPAVAPAAAPVFDGFCLVSEKTIVRRLIPRNTRRDQPMLQTCLVFASEEHGEARFGGTDEPACTSLVVYLQHIDTAAAMPFYHPMVRGVAFLHAWQPMAAAGTLSVHFSRFPAAETALLDKAGRGVLVRVALSLAGTICKHGEGLTRGYVKRVHHDRLMAQARVQDRYARLKERHARRLVDEWQETTDPVKHVFEDLAIGAFLIELWADMYGDSTDFPGFVDVGCGNGLLVHVLNEQGYRGWGFDARPRRSWQQYGNSKAEQDGQELPLRKALLLPEFLLNGRDDDASGTTHNGRFPPGTFLIANHADELTVWTPLLAAMSGCPFLAIPCCSHNFTGAKFRAPPPSAAAAAALTAVSRDASSSSTNASFVAWVMDVAKDCSWQVECEVLRIPSTRNIGLLGRHRRTPDGQASDSFTVDQAWEVINKYGGAHDFTENVAEQVKASH